MNRPILNLDQLELRTVGNGGRYDARVGAIEPERVRFIDRAGESFDHWEGE